MLALATLGFANFADASLQDGLVAYYKLDESSGTVAVDSAGNHNGTNYGASPGSQGIIGTSYFFPGISNHSYVDLNFGAGSYTSFTVQAWVRTTSPDDGAVVTSRNGFEGNLVGLALYNHTATPTFYFSRDELITGDAPANDGQWHHLVGVFDGLASMAYLYVDGVAKTASTTLTVITPLANFYLGWDAHLSDEPFRYFVGNIDEVGFWDRALTAAEVRRLFLTGSGCNIEQLVPQGDCI